MYATIVIFVFVIVLTMRFSYLRKKETDDMESFFERERKANLSPRRDISNLSYITIPLEKFPSDYIDDEEKKQAERLKALSEKPLLNLSGITNTELKERYGVANLTKLEAIGDDYDSAMLIISSLASKRLENNDIKGALSYLEFAAGTRTDVSSVYTMLGKCYSDLGETEKIRDIINIVKHLDFSLKDKVIENLSSYFQGL